jgi:lipid-A-disaccharide synthase
VSGHPDKEFGTEESRFVWLMKTFGGALALRKSSNIMMVAGETSGDMHAARVIRALLGKEKRLKIFGMGGPQMAKAGMEVREDLTRQALIGFWEVVKHYPVIRKRLQQCGKWLRSEKPDLLVLVDYPGFNLLLAKQAHRLGIPVCYYISPKVWAWNEGRLKTMKKAIRKLLVILPFEKKYFKSKGMDAVYVGNPLVEEMNFRRVKKNLVLKKIGIFDTRFPLICALPGSRKGEIEKIWPLFLETARRLRQEYPGLALIVPKPAGLDYSDYKGLRAGDPVCFVDAPNLHLRKVCDLAWVKSGTGTLETALLGTPMVVVYKVAAISGFIAKRLIKLKKVSLPNLLAGAAVVPELTQEKATSENLGRETRILLEDASMRDAQTRAFIKIKKSLCHPAKASQNAAREMLGLLANKR